MRFVLSRAGLLACSIVLALICACEEHHPGELPEVQRDRLVQARDHQGHGQRPGSSASPRVTPTPANFFPEQTPH